MPKAWYKDAYRRRWLPVPHELLSKEKEEFVALIFDGIDEVDRTGDVRLCKDVIVHVWVYLKLKHTFTNDQCIRLVQWICHRITDGEFPTYEELRFNFTLASKILSTHRPVYGLVLPWRPFYQLLDLLFFQKNRVIRTLPADLGGSIAQFVTQARCYFDEDIGGDLLQHCRPFLITDDGTIYYGLTMLVLFMPTLTLNGLRWGTERQAVPLPIRRTESLRGVTPATFGSMPAEKLETLNGRCGLSPKEKFFWVEEVMAVWQWVEHARDWDAAWLSLIARAACNGCTSPSNLLQAIRVARKKAVREKRKELVAAHDAAPDAAEDEVYEEPSFDKAEVMWNSLEKLQEAVAPVWEGVVVADFAAWLKKEKPQAAASLLALEEAADGMSDGMSDGSGHNHAKSQVPFDWSPYQEELWRIILRVVSYDIPLGTGELLDPFDHDGLSTILGFFKKLISNPHDGIAAIVVYLMQPTRSSKDKPATDGPLPAMKFLQQLMCFLETYYHPSNYGNWQMILGKLLSSLCHCFARRIGTERKYRKRLAKFRAEAATVRQQVESSLKGEEQLRSLLLLSKMDYIFQQEEERHDAAFLDDEDIAEFVTCMLPNALKGIYSKHGDLGVAAMESMQTMAYLAPGLVLPQLLENVDNDLQTLTQTHRTQSALFLLSHVARSVMSPSLYPPGIQRLESLLRLSLPGVDPNDTFKTYMTFRFFYAVMYSAPIIDCNHLLPVGEAATSAVPPKLRTSLNDLPSCRQQLEAARQCTAYFGDWAIQLLERIITHFDCTGYSKKVTFERAVQDLLLYACELLFQQVDGATYSQLLKRVFEFITTNFLPDAREPMSQLCGYLVKPHPAESLALFVPYFYNKIVEEEEEGKPSGLHRLSNNELHWSISMLKNMVKHGREALVTHRTQLTTMLRLILLADPKAKETAHVSTTVKTTTAKMLRNLIKSLAGTYAIESRSLTPEQWAAALKSSGVATDGDVDMESGDGEASMDDSLRQMRELLLYWGNSASPKDLAIAWHKPNREELTFAIDLLDSFADLSLQHISEFGTFYSSLVRASVAEIEKAASDAMDVDSGATDGSAPKGCINVPSSRRQSLQHWLRVLYGLISGGAEVLHHDADQLEQKQTKEERELVASYGRSPKFIKMAMPQHPVTDQEGLKAHPNHLLLRLSRKQIGDALNELCVALLQPGSDFDDTKVLSGLVDCMSAFLMHRTAFGQGRYTKTQAKLKLNRHKNPLKGSKDVPRHLQVEAVTGFFMKRVLYHQGYCGAVHWRMLANIVQLALHPYSAVRKVAQNVINRVILHHNLPLSSLVEMPLQVLTVTTSKKHEVIGACYLLELLLPHCCKHIAANRDWPFFCHIVTILCGCHIHKETQLQTRLSALVMGFLNTFPQVELHRYIDATRHSANVQEDLRRESEDNLEEYTKVLEFLCELFPTVSWTYQCFALQFISKLIQRYEEDIFIPDCVARTLLLALATDVLAVRELAVEGLSLLLLHLKVPRPRTKEHYETSREEIRRWTKPLYAYKEKLTSPSEWEAAQFTDPSYVGWNGRPEYCKVYVPMDTTAHLRRALMSKGEMEEEETSHHYKGQLQKLRQIVAKEVLQGEYWETVISRWSHEVRQEGSDFCSEYAELFKGFFQIFQADLLEVLKPIIVRFCAESSKREEQSIAAEMLAGLTRASKHWPYDMVQAMHAFALPLLLQGILKSDAESNQDWHACLTFTVRDLDPRRILWIVEPLTEGLKAYISEETDTTLFKARRLDAISAILMEMTWRGADLAVELVADLMPDCLYGASAMLRYPLATLLSMALSDTFQGIRSLETSVPVPATHAKAVDPRAEMFAKLHTVLYNLSQLLYAWEVEGAGEVEATVLAERACFTKTILLALVGSFGSCASRALATLTFPLLPLIFRLANHEDEDISNAATECVSLYAMTEMDTKWLNFTLTVCYQLLAGTFDSSCLRVPVVPDVSLLGTPAVEAEPGTPSASSTHKEDLAATWRQKLQILRFFQVLVFKNVFLLRREQIQELLECLIRLLCDPQVEVRSLAAITLSGMLTFVEEEEHLRLKARFEDWANLKLPKTRYSGQGQPSSLGHSSQAQLLSMKAKAEIALRSAPGQRSAGFENIILSASMRVRHSGVLGLAAIVRAYPYQVPLWMPAMLVDFAGHIHDPPPINITVKETFLEFWRVHQDAWPTEQQLFSSEQLSFLTELLVAPPYFA